MHSFQEEEAHMRVPTKIATGVVATTVGLATEPALAQPSTDQFSCMSFLWGGGWGHMLFGGFMMLSFWAGLIALVALAVRWISTDSAGGLGSTASGKTPKQILEERFAKGEIDKQEFDDRKTALAG
jgi:putative membrane protein